MCNSLYLDQGLDVVLLINDPVNNLQLHIDLHKNNFVLNNSN